MAKLTIEEGGRSTVYEILEELVTVGRQEGVSVKVSDATVGKEHCQIRRLAGQGYKLIDLESRNGTKVNGSFVNQRMLQNGDVIEVGKTRIVFTGAAPARAAPAPAPAAAPVAPRPPARPAPGPRVERARDPQEPRTYRRYSRSSNAPVIVVGVVVGMLVFLAAAVIFAGKWFEHGHNQKIWLDMIDLQNQERYREAVALAAQADPDGDRDYWEKVQAAKAEAQAVLDAGDAQADLRAMRQEFYAIEGWCQDHFSDVAGAVSRWEAFIEKHPPESLWVRQAREKLKKLMGSEWTEPGPGETDGDWKIDRRWRTVLETVKRLESQDRFHDAQEAVQDFWTAEMKVLAQDVGEWDRRVNDTLKAIDGRAEAKWRRLDEIAKQFLEKGEVDKAIDIYKEVAAKFGIPKIVQQAVKAKREAGRR